MFGIDTEEVEEGAAENDDDGDKSMTGYRDGESGTDCPPPPFLSFPDRKAEKNEGDELQDRPTDCDAASPGLGDVDGSCGD